MDKDYTSANFVIVEGRLKIIDLGIANTIDEDTVNVHRDYQVGTLLDMTLDGKSPLRASVRN